MGGANSSHFPVISQTSEFLQLIRSSQCRCRGFIFLVQNVRGSSHCGDQTQGCGSPQDVLVHDRRFSIIVDPGLLVELGSFDDFRFRFGNLLHDLGSVIILLNDLGSDGLSRLFHKILLS